MTTTILSNDKTRSHFSPQLWKIQGQKHGKKKLAAKRTKALVEATNFNETEIGALNVYFQEIGEKKGNEIVIDRGQFKKALGLKESLFINRMFLMFDTGKGVHSVVAVDCKEQWHSACSILHVRSPKDQHRAVAVFMLQLFFSLAFVWCSCCLSLLEFCCLPFC